MRRVFSHINESFAAFRVVGQIKPLLEAVNAAARVHQLLLARIEGMAVAANFNADGRACGARFKRVPARAGHGAVVILRMDAVFHVIHLFYSTVRHKRAGAG